MLEFADSPVTTLWEEWPGLSDAQRLRSFQQLPAAQRDAFFESLDPREQAGLLQLLPRDEWRLWLRSLAPDDATDVLQELPAEERGTALDLLDEATRREVGALLAYAEDDAGGLMSPRFARLRPDMTVGEAIRYLRRQARDVEILYYAYVLDERQRLIGVLSLRELFQAGESDLVRDRMRTDLVTVREDLDQEFVGRLYVEHDLMALPVVDEEGRLKGIVTFDDIADVIREEATEDIQRVGGSEALEVPYLTAPLATLVRKRGGWLAALFLGEMLTASAMAHFEEEIARAVVLALFVPLIISSGGNSGSQASTLVVRALAIGEVRLQDWWRVLRREVLVGLQLGALLAGIGFVRILVWQGIGNLYGEHYLLLAAAVATSLVGVVLWGCVAGAMLPLVLRRLRFDPASASAPFVATLVDVTGLIIYFTTAAVWLRGALL